MAADPIFAATPKCALFTLSTANTNRDGTGTVVTGSSAGSSGSNYNRLILAATGTTTAGMIRMFIHDGTNYFLVKEIAVPAIAPSASVAVWQTEIPLIDCSLPSGYSLRFTTHNAETFKGALMLGDY